MTHYIIEGYIRGQKIAITRLGENTVETLVQYCPEIIEVKLTRDLEEELEEIESGSKDASTVFSDVVEELKPILTRFKEHEEQIGQTISNAVLEKPSNESQGTCRLCHRDKLDDSVFCRRHTDAYEALETIYQQWRYALGIQWVEYLEKVSKTSGTGGLCERNDSQHIGLTLVLGYLPATVPTITHPVSTDLPEFIINWSPKIS